MSIPIAFSLALLGTTLFAGGSWYATAGASRHTRGLGAAAIATGAVLVCLALEVLIGGQP